MKHAERDRLTGYVYIVQIGQDGPVKIGHTTNFKKRIRSLQVASPYYLETRMVKIGTQEVERRLHEALSRFHIRGEWFSGECLSAENLPLVANEFQQAP